MTDFLQDRTCCPACFGIPYTRACPACEGLTPMEGGFCIRRVDQGHCLDALLMFGAWYLAYTPRSEGMEHAFIDRQWAYKGVGSTTLQTVVMAAREWSGTPETEPAGYWRRVS